MTGWQTLFLKEVLRFWKVAFQTVAAPIVTAVLYLLIFGHVLEEHVQVYDGVGYTAFLLPGLAMMSLLQNAFANSSSSLIQSKIMGNLVFVLLTPLSHRAWFAAYVGSSVVRGLVVGAGVLLVAGALAFGAIGIPSSSGYSGVGPNFLPWLTAVVLALCGVLLLREALTGGFRATEDPGGGARAHLSAGLWVSAGLLLIVALIGTLGFILSCTLCYWLAVQGLRRAAGQGAGSPRTWALDALTGALIAAPVFWVFTKFLAINLPGLTRTGWL